MNHQINDFLARYSQNKHTGEEHDRFIEWLEKMPEKNVRPILDEYPQIQKLYPTPSGDHQLLFEKIEAALDNSAPLVSAAPVHKLKTFYRVACVAAALLVALGLAVYFLNFQKQVQPSVSTAASRPAPPSSNIPPGTNKASLTLADGSTIILDDAANGLLATQSGIIINKSADGQLIYDASNINDIAAPSGFNTVATPRGGQYKLILPDGSKVWLNAASSLKFPASFTGSEERGVELSGEAYFEVAKNKDQPFRISSGNQVVEVLGTHFNINAYKDDGNIRTTLLEGSVKVSQSETRQSKILSPGQQTTLSETIRVSNVDARQAVAWKNGYFVFNREDIKSIMLKIERWYDVDVEYNGNITTEGFVGSVSRYEYVSELLDMLQLTGLVHFKVEGRKIIVMP